MKEQTLYYPSVPTDRSTLVDILHSRASAMPEKTAFHFASARSGQKTELTYRSLNERAMAIAGELQTFASPGDRAILLYSPGLEFIEAFWGCLYAGVVAVPVAPPIRNRLTSSVMAVLTAANPSLILSTADKCEHMNRPGSPLADMGGRRWIATDSVSSDRRHAWSDPDIDSRQTALLQYTSGSTSIPKGVVLSHANLLHNAALIQNSFGTSPESRAVFWLPLYHDMGLIGGVIQPVYSGASCTQLTPTAFLQRPALWLEMISRTRATISGGPDFAYDWCVRKVTSEEREGLDLSCWEVAFTGSERVRASTLERFSEMFSPCGFRSEAFLPCYGMAEATLMVSGGPRLTMPRIAHVHASALARRRVEQVPSGDPAALGLVGCGKNLPGQQVVIVHSETGHICADNEVGEIWVRGVSVGGGYFEQPESTAEVFQARLADTGDGPFLRTGDLGFLLDEQLFVTGRLKDLIVIRGRNYYPDDVEQSLREVYSGLRAGHCAAFSIEVENQERLVVVQEVEPRQRNLDTEAALQAIRLAIAVHHEVEAYAIVLVKAGEIPKTSSGKTRRSECRERYLNDELETIAVWQARMEDLEDEPWDGWATPRPQTVTAADIQSWLQRRIAARLHLAPEQVHADTPFFEFGIRSLDAVRIAADLERWLGRRLTPIVIYNHPNITDLAQWLAAPPAEEEVYTLTSQVPVLPTPLDEQALMEEIRHMSESDLEAFIQQQMLMEASK